MEVGGGLVSCGDHTTYFHPNPTADWGAYSPLRWINIRARGTSGKPVTGNYDVMASHSVERAIADLSLFKIKDRT